MATFLKDNTFTGSNGSHFKSRLEFSYTQNTANNQTTITYYLYFQSKDGWSGSGSANSITGYIGGTGSGDKVGTTSSIGVNQTKLLGSRSYTITHNADGTFPNTNYSSRIDSGWNNVNRSDISGTLTSSNIPKINRSSTWATSPVILSNIEDEFSLPINQWVSDYYNVVTISNLQNTTTIKTINNAVNGTTVQFSNSELNQIYAIDNNPSTNTQRVYLNLYTYDSNNNQIGDVQRTYLDAPLTNANPTATITTTEQNANVVSVLGGASTSKVVNYVSILYFQITATALKGSSITSVKVNGLDATLDSGTYKITLSNIQTGTFNVVVTDTRGNTYSETISKTLLDYILLNIPTSWDVERVSPVSNNLVLNAVIDCYSSTIDGNANTPTVQYSVDNTNWSTIPSSSYTFSSNKITITNLTLNNLIPYQQSGKFYLKVSDLLTTANDNKDVKRGIYTYGAGEDFFVINGDLLVRDADGNNEINVLDYIDEKNNYSTTEKIVGVWKDGRPIYRKVHNFTTTAGWQSFPKSTISNDIDRIVRIGGIVKQSSGTQVPIPYYINSSDFANVYYAPQSNYFVVTTGSSYGFGDTHIYVEYVKSS